MIDTIFFSPSGTSARIARALAALLDEEAAIHDITVTFPETLPLSHTGLALFAVPVYAGRLPALAAERLRRISGNGRKAVAVVVYGNRDYDDALAELCDILAGQDFNVVAAGAFIAQHCIFPKVATGRPDSADLDKLAEFAADVRRKLTSGEPLDLLAVKGNRPYKKAAGVPLHPDVDKARCTACSTCATECPAGAIDVADPTRTDGSKCITCCRCINVCPEGARSLGGVLYKVAGWKFVRDNSRRLEPEWFV